MKKIVIGGSTGTIGTKTLSIIEENNDFKVIGLIANLKREPFQKQIEKFKPKYIVFSEKLLQLPKGTIQLNEDEAEKMFEKCDLFVNGISGLAGLKYTIAALKEKTKIALANKESIVIGAKILKKIRKNFLDYIIPVDSEHSAIFQLLREVDKNDIEKIYLTASGGKIKNREITKNLGPREILDHPNWQMGAIITVDSSTMVNKAYEVIEAHHLFDIPYKKIDILFHPEAVVHGLVKLKDKNILLQLAPTDMLFPIRYALYYPKRKPYNRKNDMSYFSNLTFEPVNFNLYPNFHLFIGALKKSNKKSAALIYGNQKAVELFLHKKIKFNEIYNLNKYVVEHYFDTGLLKLDELENIYRTIDTIIKNYLGGIV